MMEGSLFEEVEKANMTFLETTILITCQRLQTFLHR